MEVAEPNLTRFNLDQRVHLHIFTELSRQQFTFKQYRLHFCMFAKPGRIRCIISFAYCLVFLPETKANPGNYDLQNEYRFSHLFAILGFCLGSLMWMFGTSEVQGEKLKDLCRFEWGLRRTIK